jgi:anti-sigma factor RsiW
MCPRFEDLVRRYNTGRISADEARKVESHLEICFDCRRAAARPKSLRELNHSPILRKSRPVAAWLTLAIAGAISVAILTGRVHVNRSAIPYWPAAAPASAPK